MNIRRYLFARSIQVIVTFFIILTLLFILFRVAPGDPILMVADQDMSAEDVEILKIQFGLDRPMIQQYFIYIWNFVQGKFGTSFHYREPVVNVILDRLPNTALLFTTATFLSAMAGIIWGKMIAWRKGTFLDVSLIVFGLGSHTLFIPWVGLIMIWIFSYQMGWFPLNAMITPELWLDPETGVFRKYLDVAHHMVLPMVVLFLHDFGRYLLLMRTSMLDTLRQDYILTARAKGLTEKVIRDRHALPNASLPVVTSVGLSLAFSINGGALTETVFSWPGLGRELVFSISNNDYPLAQASFLLIASFVLVANMIVDVIYSYLDPRIRY